MYSSRKHILSRRRLQQIAKKESAKYFHHKSANQKQQIRPQCAVNEPVLASRLEYNHSEVSEDESCEVKSTSSKSSEDNCELVDKLKDWALATSVNHTQFSSLLKILKTHSCFSDMPSDCRTLFSIKQVPSAITIEPGEYVHLGIQRVIDSLQPIKSMSLPLQINIDGLPLFKSSRVQLWPILGYFKNLTEHPFVIGVYCGEKKPVDVNKFLQTFVEEFNSIKLKYPVQFYLHSFVCDAPAKAFIKCVKGHNSYHGCDKCSAVGIREMNRVTFSTKKGCHRTDQEFRDQSDEDHHTGRSILENISGINMIDNFAIDYMHLICLGVTKKLVLIWLKGKPGPHKLSGHNIDELNKMMSIVHKQTVCDFARKPRSFLDTERWKATEFRQLLLYTGPVVFANILSEDSFKIFMCLSVAVRILSSESLNSEYNDYADCLLSYFVEHFPILFGKETTSYNIHNLLHLACEAKRLGPLDSFSAFRYESKLGKLKSLVRSPNKPLQQLIVRILEREVNIIPSVESNTLVLGTKHKLGPIPDKFSGEQFTFINLKNSKVRRRNNDNEVDSFVLTKTNQLYVVHNIYKKSGDSQIYLLTKGFTNKSPLFTYPCSSELLSIYKFQSLKENLEEIALSSVSVKCQTFKINDEFIALPMIHHC